MRLANSQALYEYVVNLAAWFREHGAESMAEMVAAASRHGAGLSTESLGESRIALEKVLSSP